MSRTDFPRATYSNTELITAFVAAAEIEDGLSAWLLTTALAISLWVSFVIVLVVGPALIAPDLANNAMPLYLCRGLRRRDYVHGKLLALFLVTGAPTWAPGSLLVLLSAETVLHESSLAGARLALALAATTLVWTGLLAMVAFAISAWVKTRPVATLGFLGFFVMADVSGDLRGGWVGSAIDPADAIVVVGRTLYGLGAESPLPAWAAWAVLLLGVVAAAAALAYRIRGVELA